MKGFFKKHPELLILLIVVIAVDIFIVWMWLDDLSATEKSKQAHERIKNDAKAINDSPWRINSENASLAEEELEKWVKSFDELVLAQQGKYQFDIDYKKTDQAATAKRVLKTKIDHLSQQLLKEKDLTGQTKLSFYTYAYENTLLTMKADEIETVFTVLKGLEELIENCVKADVVSVDSVQRPNELIFEEDKSIYTKRYTYVLSVTATSEGLKKLINEIVNNKKFFFEINSLRLEADSQIVSSASDHVPVIKRIGNTQGAAIKQPRGIRGLEEGLDNLIGSGKKEEIDSDEPIIYKDSISPFTQAINKIVISIDWVQFSKE
ncbi:MAG: Amuc_1100 family pilus-like protein [Lentisphaeraceae bacterium]|nr:Amuc_1100 family pilus-like protein [Lentisphaeraceae bacterium]